MIMMAVAMGCVGLPESSRTGQAHRVSISDRDISPKDLTVQSGDQLIHADLLLAKLASGSFRH
jgi:hypothetical protein